MVFNNKEASMLATHFLPIQVVVQVRKTKKVTVTITPAGQERRDRLLRADCCLGCEKKFAKDEERRRGQCKTCYAATMAKIRDNKITAQEKIAAGELLEPKIGGRPPKNKYTRSLPS